MPFASGRPHVFFIGKAVNVPYTGLMYVMMNVIKIVKMMMIITIKIMIQYCYAVHGAPYASLMYVVLWDHTSHTVPAFL